MATIGWNKLFEVAWRALVFIMAAAIIAIVVMNWNRWEGGAGWQRTNDAYLESDLTPITSKVAGYVQELPIQDYDHVHKGQVLAQLVDIDYRAAVAQAAASIASATAQGQTLEAQRQLQLSNIEATRAVVAASSALRDQNDRDLARQARLFATGSSSTEIAEKLETTHAQLEAQLAQNRAQESAAERQLSVSFPGHTLRGHLLAFAPASGAEFALLPPDNATGNYTKVVQRIPIKIAIDDVDGLADRIVPGMSIEASIDARGTHP